MTKEEIEDLIKKSIVSNMVVQVDITKDNFYSEGCVTVVVNVTYDDEPITSFSDSFSVDNFSRHCR